MNYLQSTGKYQLYFDELFPLLSAKKSEDERVEPLRLLKNLYRAAYNPDGLDRPPFAECYDSDLLELESYDSISNEELNHFSDLVIWGCQEPRDCFLPKGSVEHWLGALESVMDAVVLDTARRMDMTKITITIPVSWRVYGTVKQTIERHEPLRKLFNSVYLGELPEDAYAVGAYMQIEYADIKDLNFHDKEFVQRVDDYLAKHLFLRSQNAED